MVFLHSGILKDNIDIVRDNVLSQSLIFYDSHHDKYVLL